jgi:hypothetical protein
MKPESRRLNMTRLKRLLVGIALILFIPSICFTQENQERTPIKIFKKGLCYRYTYQTKPLRTWADFHAIMRSSPEALSQLNKARINSGLSTGLGIVGGFLIGWPIGQAIGQELFRLRDREPTWVLAAVGGGLVAIGVGFGIGSARQLKKGVDIYNQGIAVAFGPNSIYIRARL